MNRSNPTLRQTAFVINNYTEPDLEALQALEVEISHGNSTLDYLKYALEIGDEGTPHIQGFAYWTKPLRMKKAKTTLRPENPTDIHLDFPIGSQKEAIRYVGAEPGTQFRKGPKTGKVLEVYEFGSRPGGQGKRKDIEAVQELLDKGVGMEEVAQSYFGTWCRNHRAFDMYRTHFSRAKRQRRDMPDVYVLWGGTGVGKSVVSKALAETYCSFEKIYTLSRGTSNNTWFTGCEGSEVLFIDDFYGWLKYSLLLNILDRWDGFVPVHGSQIRCPNWKAVIITSNQHPMKWYNKIPDCSALMRRLSHQYMVTEPIYERVLGPGNLTRESIKMILSRYEVNGAMVDSLTSPNWAKIE